MISPSSAGTPTTKTPRPTFITTTFIRRTRHSYIVHNTFLQTIGQSTIWSILCPCTYNTRTIQFSATRDCLNGAGRSESYRYAVANSINEGHHCYNEGVCNSHGTTMVIFVKTSVAMKMDLGTIIANITDFLMGASTIIDMGKAKRNLSGDKEGKRTTMESAESMMTVTATRACIWTTILLQTATAMPELMAMLTVLN